MLRKNTIKLILKALVFITISTPVLANTYKHSLGTIEVEGTPQRVVVLGFGSLDFVDALGVTPVAMPKKLLPARLAKYQADEFVNTGSLQEVDYETLFTIKPDLIIAEARMAQLYKDLAEIAPTYMFQINSKNYWESTQEHWKNISQILDKEEQGLALIKDIQTRIDKLHTDKNGKSLSALTVMSNGNNITSFGPDSRFSFIYHEAGFKPSASNNVASNTLPHGNLISFEYIADAKPDTLLILDRDQAIGNNEGQAKKLFDNPLIASTPAGKNNKIVYLDPTAWYLVAGGYHSLQTMISDLESALH